MLKDKIVALLSSKQYTPTNKNKIYESFKNVPFDEFEKELSLLIENYDVVVNKKGNVMLSSREGYLKGSVTGIKEDMLFVKLPNEEKDIKIDLNNNTSNIRLKDDVLIKNDNGSFKLVKVVKHNLKELVGEYKLDTIRGQKIGFFVPENKNYRLSFKVSSEDAKNLVDGHKVVFSLSDGNSGSVAKLEKIIGHKNDVGVDIKTKILEAEAPIEFSKEAMEQAENLPDSINKADFKDRLDLTDKVLFTIDGEDAKDLDDAVECYKLENGNYFLGVHIADVSHYVQEESPLDVDANARGTSIYLADRVVPMYPHKLSNGICSLNPYVDRLAMTCYMEIDNNGKVVSYSIHESVINSKKRFTYTEVNEILEKNNQEVIEKNKEFVPMLKDLQELAHLLRKNRDERGQIELDIRESKIIVDEKGKAIDIKFRERGEGEKLIEDCMIAANESVAEAVSVLELPYLYRVHDVPETEKIRSFGEIANALGIRVRYTLNTPTSTYIRKVLEAASLNQDKKEILSTLFLRSLPKAIYDSKNIGHFGLGSECYTHFTSPIRRYPDTTVHRMLKKYIINQEYLKDDFDEKYYAEKMKEIGSTTSSQERRAIQLERDVIDMKKAEYMESKVGQEFVGKVSGFVDKGMFIQLPNSVEGFVSFSTMDDFYRYNHDLFQAEGRRTGHVIKLGSSFKVKVVSADKETSKIDFKISELREKDFKDYKKR